MSESHLDAPEFQYAPELYSPNRLDSPGDAFPTVAMLRRGALLCTIAHAVWLAYSNLQEHWWNGDDYSCSDTQGTHGAVSFVGDEVVAAFLDSNSPRTKRFHQVEPGTYDWDWHWLVVGMPPDLLDAALKPDGVIHGFLDSLGTCEAVFWSVNGRLTAAEPWPSVYDHGAHILRDQLMEPDALRPKVAEDYQFNGEQMAVIRAIFERKMRAGNTEVVVAADEKRVILEAGIEDILQSRRRYPSQYPPDGSESEEILSILPDALTGEVRAAVAAALEQGLGRVRVRFSQIGIVVP